jgi:SPRY domain
VTSRTQQPRSSVKKQRPPAATRRTGELYVNFADKQLGVIDPNRVAQDLLAVRFFSDATDYLEGDHVVANGAIQRASQAVPSGSPFNPAQWEVLNEGDSIEEAPIDGKFYGRVDGTWDPAGISDIANLQAALDLKAPLSSPALTNIPTAPTAPNTTNTNQLATTAFVKNQNYVSTTSPELSAKVARAGDSMTGPLVLNADPSVPMHAATKQYVDSRAGTGGGGGAGGGGATIQPTPPASPVAGQFWWESDTAALFMFYDDGNSQTWIQVNGTAGSGPGPAPGGPAPINTAAPIITGTQVQGQLLTVSQGTWSNSPTSYAYQWFRTNTAISGATTATYLLQAADVGTSLYCRVTASNSGGSATAQSNTTGLIGGAVSDTTPDPFSFTDVAGAALSTLYTSNTLIITGINAPSPISISGGTYILNNGAPTSASGTVVANDKVTVQVTSAAGNSASANATLTIGGVSDTFTVTTAALGAPINTALPNVTGSPVQGQTLTVTNGAWSNSPTSYTYQWFRDSTAIPGATASTYILGATDIGTVVHAKVTATNPGGSTTVQSNVTATVTASPTTPAVVWGTTGNGADVVISGAWNQTASRNGTSIPYRSAKSATSQNAGLRYVEVFVNTAGSCAIGVCNAGANMENYPGSDNFGASYPSDYGFFYKNGVALGTATPGLYGDGAIVGVLVDFTAHTMKTNLNGGAFSAPVDIASLGADVFIAGGMSPNPFASVLTLNAVLTYPLPSGATEWNGAAPPPPAPVNTVIPNVIGTPTEGRTLTTSNGAWSNNPTSYAYQWFRSPSTAIPGATAITYVLTSADVGQTIYAKVTATNAGGAATAQSNTTPLIAMGAPTNTVAPVVTGTATQGQTLTTTSGTWTGSPTFAYQWYRATTVISGATATSYVLQAADVGSTIHCKVTATNVGGSTTVQSNVTAPVAAPAPIPVNTTPPALSGTQTQGQTLTTTNGTWSNSPTSYSYQWFRGSTAISGATSTAYVLQAADVGQILHCKVTAGNANGSATAASNNTGAIAAGAAPGAPVNTTPPTIAVLTTLTVGGQAYVTSDGVWTNAPPSFTYQWFRGATPVGASGPSYGFAAGDVGSMIHCRLTGTNANGSSTAISNSLGPVTA